MKKLLTLTLFAIISFSVQAQYSNRAFEFEGKNRQYRVYIPTIYNSNNPAALVICLHGMGDNMTNFSGIGMKSIADTANFIAVFPQALVDPLMGATLWNSGAGAFGYFPNSDIDDVSFLAALIDTLSASYSINQSKVYATGFSMGGFMTNRLACDLPNRIAATASVAGTLGAGITCNSYRAVPVCHFHGTADATIPITGSQFGNSVEDLLNYWIDKNQCNPTAQRTDFPDIASDGYTVEKYVNANVSTQNNVEFYKVNNADHVWLGPSNDVNYAVEAWKFFMQHTHPNPMMGIDKIEKQNFSISPVPTEDLFSLNWNNVSAKEVTISVTDVLGKNVWNSKHNNVQTIEFSAKTMGLKQGVYLMTLSGEKMNETHKIVIR